MSISRPAPKPAVAPKTEPRRSAIETSVTSTMSAVPPNGVYAESIETCTSTATKMIAKALSESSDHRAVLGFFGHEDEHRLERRRGSRTAAPGSACRCRCRAGSRSSPSRSGCCAGRSRAASLPPGEPAVMIVSPFSTRLSLPTSVEHERVGRAALLRACRPTTGCDASTARTALLGSLISITSDGVRRSTFVTWPTSAPPLTTTSSTATPWFEPAAIVTLWSNVVGFVSTVGGDGAVVLRERAASRGSRAAVCRSSVLVPAPPAPRRARSRSVAVLAPSAACSRTWRGRGRSSSSRRRGTAVATRFAAISNGRSTDAPKLCTGSSASERNDSVIRTSESSDEAPHDDLAPEGARAIRGVAGGRGTLGGRAQHRETGSPVTRHARSHRASAVEEPAVLPREPPLPRLPVGVRDR